MLFITIVHEVYAIIANCLIDFFFRKKVLILRKNNAYYINTNSWAQKVDANPQWSATG